MIEVLEEGLDEALTARFINVQQAPCKQSQFDQQAMQVEFSQVSGLWIMLAAAVGVGALLVAWRWYWIKWGRPSCEQSCCGTGYKNTAKKVCASILTLTLEVFSLLRLPRLLKILILGFYVVYLYRLMICRPI